MSNLEVPPPSNPLIMWLVIGILSLTVLTTAIILNLLFETPAERAQAQAQAEYLAAEKREFAAEQAQRAQQVSDAVDDPHYAAQLVNVIMHATREDLYLAARQRYVWQVAMPLIIISIIFIYFYRRKK